MGMKKEMNDARLLMEFFDKKYRETYRENYLGNSHSDVWGFRSMIQDLGFEAAHDVIGYYFKTSPNRGHSRDHLLYNYHTYKVAMDAARAEKRSQRKLVQKMKEDFGEG